MATNPIIANESFGGLNQVLASSNGLRSPRMLTLDLANFSFTQGKGLLLKAGTVLTRLPSGRGRAFPSAVADAVTATTSGVISVQNANLFKVGDVVIHDTGEAIGTVQAIDTENGTITLDANTTTAIASGDVIIANDASAGVVQGIIVADMDIEKNNNDVAAYTSASVYEARMPFWRASFQAALPEITLVGPAA